MFLIFISGFITFAQIPAWVYSDKYEYSIGEKVEIYGFLIQGYLSGGCPLDLFEYVYDSEGKKLVAHSVSCAAVLTYHPPMKLYTNAWDQKVMTNYSAGSFEREQVEPGEYTLIYMEQKIPITIRP